MNRALLQEYRDVEELRRQLPEPPVRAYLRRRAGLSQQQAANVLDVSRVTVARWESGTRSPADEHLADYLELLGVTA